MRNLTLTKYKQYLSRQILGASAKAYRFIESPLFFRLFLLLFILQSLFYAVAIIYQIPPDEAQHLDIIRIYAWFNPWPIFTEQTDYFYLGDLTREPSLLFHYLLSFPYRIIDFLPHSYEVVLLRVLNVAFATASVLILHKIAKLKLNDFYANILVFLATTTMMFSFLAGSINYDNLFLLCVYSSVYLLLQLMRKRTLKLILLWLFLIIISPLVKEAFLPISLAQGLVFIIIARKDVFAMLNELKHELLSRNAVTIILSLAIILATGMFIEKYGTNVVQYGSTTPQCTQIYDHKTCYEYGIYKRSIKLTELKDPEFVPTFREFIPRWVYLMTNRIVGVHAHQSTEPWKIASYTFLTVWTILLIAIIRKYNFKDKWVHALLFITAVYVFALLTKNYGSFSRYGIHLAVQGRYLFPILPLMYLVGLYYVSKQKHAQKLVPLAMLIIIPIMYLSNIPAYIHNSPREHFNSLALPVVDFVKSKTQVIFK